MCTALNQKGKAISLEIKYAKNVGFSARSLYLILDVQRTNEWGGNLSDDVERSQRSLPA